MKKLRLIITFGFLLCFTLALSIIFCGCSSNNMYNELKAAIENKSSGKYIVRYILKDYDVDDVNDELMSFFARELEDSTDGYICDVLNALRTIDFLDANEAMSNMIYSKVAKHIEEKEYEGLELLFGIDCYFDITLAEKVTPLMDEWYLQEKEKGFESELIHISRLRNVKGDNIGAYYSIPEIDAKSWFDFVDSNDNKVFTEQGLGGYYDGKKDSSNVQSGGGFSWGSSTKYYGDFCEVITYDVEYDKNYYATQTMHSSWYYKGERLFSDLSLNGEWIESSGFLYQTSIENERGLTIRVFGIEEDLFSSFDFRSVYEDFNYSVCGRNAVRILSYDGNKEEVVIPDKIKGVPVVEIGSSAFEGCDSLISIVIPNSVISIGFEAFSYCDSLTSVSFGENSQLMSIGFSAFKGCYSLTSIVIPNGVTSIGNEAFYYCDSLTSVSFGENSQLMSIGNSTFSLCFSLSSIVIPNNVTSIGDEVFNACRKLKSVSFGENSQLMSIGSYAFEGCDSLTSIVIPNSVTSIGHEAFEDCDKLYLYSETIGTPIWKFRTEDTPCVFGYNKYITVDDVVYAIVGDVAILVQQPKCITDIKIRENINYNGKNYKLTKVVGNAFEKCESLNYNIKSGLKYLGNETNKYLCLIGAVSTDIRKATIDSNCRYIVNKAFYDCDLLTEVTMPNTLLSIGGCGVFSGCESLNYNIKDGLKYLGNEENKYLYFAGVEEEKKDVIIDENCKFIGDNAFYGCDSVRYLTIPSGVVSFGSSGSTLWSFSAVTYGGTIDQWAEIDFENGDSNPLSNTHAFYINDVLVTEVILTEAKRVSDYAFYEYNSLTKIKLGESVESVGEYAFSGNLLSLESVEINGAKGIGDYAFAHCSIKNVNILEGTTSIGCSAFAWCDISSLVLPSSIKSICSNAFYFCNYSLKRVYYGGTVESWERIEFSSYIELRDVPRYYYIEKEENLPTEYYNYWHYVDGEPTVWEIGE